MALSRPFKEDRLALRSSLHASLLQAIDGVMPLALCPQTVPQAPQHFRPAEKPATCVAVPSIFISKAAPFCFQLEFLRAQPCRFRFTNDKQKRLARDVIIHQYAAHAGLVNDVTDTDCWAQNGPAHMVEFLLLFLFFVCLFVLFCDC